MDTTPKGNRLHIAIFGRTNVGKSSLLNYLIGQEIAITSPVAGTTTDVVEKAAELLPLGPVLFLDTAGLDDVSELAAAPPARRREKIFDRADCILLVTEAETWTGYEECGPRRGERAEDPGPGGRQQDRPRHPLPRLPGTAGRAHRAGRRRRGGKTGRVVALSSVDPAGRESRPGGGQAPPHRDGPGRFHRDPVARGRSPAAGRARGPGRPDRPPGAEGAAHPAPGPDDPRRPRQRRRGPDRQGARACEHARPPQPEARRRHLRLPGDPEGLRRRPEGDPLHDLLDPLRPAEGGPRHGRGRGRGDRDPAAGGSGARRRGLLAPPAPGRHREGQDPPVAPAVRGRRAHRSTSRRDGTTPRTWATTASSSTAAAAC